MLTHPSAVKVSSRETRFDILRIIAALQVLLCHFAVIYAGQWHAFDVDTATLDKAASPLLKLLLFFYYQFHGAYLFLAISGYLILLPWMRDKPQSAPYFLKRRAIRLLPASTVAIAAAAVFDFFNRSWMSPDPLRLVANLTFLNWLDNRLYPPYLIVTWSLAAEWLFYLLVPLLGGLIRWRYASGWLFLGLGLVVAIALKLWMPNFWVCALYFALGIAVAFYRKRLHGAMRLPYVWWIALLLIVGASLLYAAQAPIQYRPVGLAWKPFDAFFVLHFAATALLLLWASMPEASPVLPSWMAHASMVSYSFYLWHFPVLLLIFGLTQGATLLTGLGDGVRLPLLLLISASLTWLVAGLSFHLLEAHYFRKKQ